jgi:glycosyltransferase involved in cell wall biosynthesis
LIFICIPAYEEARTVGVLLWRVRQVMAGFPRDYQLLVLDDGSTDDTQEVLAPYARVLPLTVLRNETRQGYAAAVERLVREATDRSTHPKRDVVVLVQADFTEDPEDIPTLVKRIEGGADVVGPLPRHDASTMSRSRRWMRRGLPLLFRRAGLPQESGDPLAGFRAYRISVLRKALAERNGDRLLSRSGDAANVELLLAVLPHARRLESAEVASRPERRQRESRFHPWGTAVELWNLARVARRRPGALAVAEE